MGMDFWCIYFLKRVAGCVDFRISKTKIQYKINKMLVS